MKSKIVLTTIYAIGILLLIGVSISGANQTNISENINAVANCDPLENKTVDDNGIKNVIVLVPDGCSQSLQTIARWYNGGKLQVDDMSTGMISTYMTNSLITDSAPAATAFATGYKSTDKFISVGPNSTNILSTVDTTTLAEPYVPLATVLEAAKLNGKSTGLVVTSEITHATPAAFAAHVDARSNYDDIIEQMVYQNMDVVFGGGKDFLNDSRNDGENLTKVLQENGYQFIQNNDEMKKVQSGKVWGSFANISMSPDIDRQHIAPDEPSLSDMTQKAIQLLSENENGFFLMVEGSQVDWGDHANDPSYAINDFVAFDKAVEKAVNFAKKDGNTIVLAFSDHETGGISLGSQYDEDYTKTTVEDLVNPIRKMNSTYQYLETQISDMNNTAEIKEKTKQFLGIDLTDAELNDIANSGDFETLVNTINHNYTIIGWTTWGHTGEDIPIWIYGPSDLIGRRVQNTEIATSIANNFGYDLKDVNNKLFVDVSMVFPSYTLDSTDSKNPVLKIGNYSLPVNKNIMINDTTKKEQKFNGVVVNAPKADNGNGKIYIPQEAVDLINE